MFVIIANNRGGVGKTTFAFNIAVYAGEIADYSVLCVDTDLNQLDLCKYLLDVKEDKVKDVVETGEIMDTKFDNIKLWVGDDWREIFKLEKEADVVIVDTHPNIYKPAEVRENDVLVIPFEGAFSIENAKDLIDGVKTKKIVGVLNKTVKSKYIGMKEMQRARKLGVLLYPYPISYNPVFRKMELERVPIYNIGKARQYLFADAVEDFSAFVLHNVGGLDYFG